MSEALIRKAVDIHSLHWRRIGTKIDATSTKFNLENPAAAKMVDSVLKARMVGTRLGSWLMEYSRWKHLKSINKANPEMAACAGNAVLAERLVTRLCPPGGIFLDVGAHIGSIFSEVYRFDKSISIYAVEAQAEKAHALRNRFPYCKVFDFALGETDGVAEFQINPAESGYNTLNIDSNSSLGVVSVMVKTLDSLSIGGVVDLIKIDVEGAELGVLRGGKNLLLKDGPTLMFESIGLEVNSLGYSAEEVWNFLNKIGYQIFLPSRLAHDAAPLSLDAFIDSHFYPFHTHNYFAVSCEKRIHVRDRARAILKIRASS